MSEKVFFTSSYLQKTVAFDEESEWVLLEKLTEDVKQQNESEAEEFGANSYSVARFLCCKVDEPERKMIMKIFMQIPFAGAELEKPSVRQKEATEKLPRLVQYEAYARGTLAAAECDSAPILRGFKRDKQRGQTAMVPFGWIIYMLIPQLPGGHLGCWDATSKTRFWSYPASVRAEIRKAFKISWEHCVEVGVLPEGGSLENLWWDPVNKKVYIDRFVVAHGAKLKRKWDDLVFALWDLMRRSWTPTDRSDVEYSPDKNWVL